MAKSGIGGREVIRVLVWLGIALGVIFFYAFVHEGSHALMALAFGGKITAFEINFFRNSPHISYVGVSDPLQRALISLAGPVLPLLLIGVMAILLPRSKSLFVQGTLLVLLISLLSTMMTSIVIALAFGLGANVAGEDVANFIQYSGLNPFLVAGAFFVLFVILLIFLFKVARVKETAIRVYKGFRNPAEKHRVTRGEMVLTAVFLLVIAIAVLPNIVGPSVHVSEPASYQARIDLDLSEITPASTVFYSFDVTEPTTYDFIYSLEAKSDFTLRLVNLGGELLPFNNQDSIVMFQGSGKVPQAYFTGFTLLEGSYALEASPGSSGTLRMYIDTKEPDEVDLYYLELVSRVNDGTFTAESYQEEGYELIYQGELTPGKDQLMLTVPGIPSERKVSAFVLGEGEVSLTYAADGQTHTLLEGFKATIGRGLPVHRSEGEIWASVWGAPVEVYIYSKEN